LNDVAATRDDEIARGLEQLAARLAPGGTGISGLRRLSGGAVQETYTFAVTTPAGAVPLVLRRGHEVLRRERAHGVSLAEEARAIELAGAGYVPVPRVVHVLEEQDGLGQGFVSAFVDGESIPRRILREDAYRNARAQLAGQCGRVLALLHGLPTGPFDFLETLTPAAFLARLDAQYQALDRPGPVFECALRWLSRALPTTPKRLAVVHGDFRNGNLLVGSDGLKAVLDWEGVHLGDAAEDIAYLTVRSWRFGELGRPVGGFGSRRQLMDAYKDAGGIVPSIERLRFWEVFYTLWWGLVCAEMARQFMSRADYTVERGAVGRRRSEAEIDLVVLLGAEA
jgi:aminoglycoside phosphotransferase (APT) family kinase protein